jgi:hypothetical protein
MRSVQSYSRIIRDFFVRVQKALNEVTSADVMGLCFGTTQS